MESGELVKGWNYEQEGLLPIGIPRLDSIFFFLFLIVSSAQCVQEAGSKPATVFPDTICGKAKEVSW